MHFEAFVISCAVLLATGCDSIRMIDDTSDAGHNPPPLLFYDDFEQALPGPADRVQLWRNADVTLSQTTTRAYRGKGALYGRIPAQSSSDEQSACLEKTLPRVFQTGSLYVRFFLFVPSGFGIRNWLVLTTLNYPPGDASHKLSLDVGEDDILQLTNNVSSSFYHPATFRMPRDRWACMEMGVRISATHGEMQLWVDGELRVTGDDQDNTLPPEGISWTNFGIDSFPPKSGSAVELYLDEFAISTERIGCDR